MTTSSLFRTNFATFCALPILLAVGACSSAGPNELESGAEIVRAELLPAGGWTAWLNRDGPGGVGDFEDRASFPSSAIPCATPIAIAARTVAGAVDYRDTGERLTVSPDLGLVCRNVDQPDQTCLDYQVAFLCPSPSAVWSGWLNRDSPSGAGDFETLPDFDPTLVGCSVPIAIQARTVSGVDWHVSGEVLSVSPTIGLVCRNTTQPDGSCQDYQVRFLCDTPRVCGTRGAAPCNPGEACLHDERARDCGFADGPGFCAAIPLSCSSESAPVCGCDGLTYQNSCAAEQTAGGYFRFGPC